MTDVSLNLIILLTALGGVTYGLSISSLSTQLITANSGFAFSQIEETFISNSNLFGTFVASFLLIFITQRVRKWKLMFFGLFSTAFFNLLLIFAPLLVSTTWAFYYTFCNFFLNFSIAFYIVALPIVVAELSSGFSKRRGYLLIMLELAIAIGGFARKGLELCITIPYNNNEVVEKAEIIYSVQFIISLLCTGILIGFLAYLYKYLPLGHKIDAPSSLMQKRILKNIFFDTSYRYPLLIAVAIGPLQEFTGINMMLYNDFSVEDILWRLPQSELKQNYEELTTALKMQEFMGEMMNIVAVAFTIPFIERFGRRTLLLCGTRAICILLILLGICAAIYNAIEPTADADDGVSQAILEVLDALRVLFMFCFEFGPGCLFWVVIGEYFPAEYRMTFASIAFCGNWGTSVLEIGFKSLSEYYTWAVYFINALLLCLWQFVINRSMPEVAGMKLNDIQDQFQDFGEKRLVMV